MTSYIAVFLARSVLRFLSQKFFDFQRHFVMILARPFELAQVKGELGVIGVQTWKDQ